MLKFFEDPGHGWLEVPMDLIRALGVAADISGYSYRKGTMAYLEEDCDAAVFLEAFRKQYGTSPALDRVYQDPTPIRSYSRYV
jgi:hypothetical protein